MIEITVYGTGCKKCRELHSNTLAAVDGLGEHARVSYVSDPVAIAQKGILSLPALEVGGRVVSTGRVLTAAQVRELLENAGPCAERC
ncbi:MAG: thioredoxin family protein [Coriobacteriales bacterium]